MIKLLFVQNKGFLFKRIRKLINSDYDHVALIISDTELIEATPFKGVHIEKIEKYKNTYTRSFNLRYKELEEPILKYIKSKIGKKYDLLHVLSLYFFILFNIDLKKSPIDLKNSFICSELIVESAEYAGFKFPDGLDTDRITPQDLLNSELIK